MRENENYYKKKIYLILFMTALIFGVLGLYEYYKVKIANPFQLISAVLYGTIKLFLFVSPIPAEDSTPFYYEVAKWLAPILTSAFVFIKISNTLLHLKNMVFNKVSREHILIFENGFMGEALINNLINEKNSYKFSLISRNSIDDNQKSRYEKKGIATYQMDFENSSEIEIKELLSGLNIDKVKYMFFCSDIDLENYALYTNIIKRIKPKRHITCYVNCESKTVATYIEDMISQERMKEGKLKNIDTVHFDRSDLTIRMLLADRCVSKSISDSLNTLSHINEEITEDIIDESIREIHILIMGTNELTLILLKHISNDLTISLKNKTKVSIIDNEAGASMSKLLSGNEGLKQSLDIEIVNTGSEKELLLKYLKSIKNDKDLFLIFLMNEDVVKNLKNLKILDMYFEDVPKIIRNVSDVDLSYVLPQNHEKIKIFGDISQIMTSDVMIRESLDNRAKKFNESYNKASAIAGMGEGKKWNELSYIKKTSSRSASAHTRIKEEIIKKIFFDKSDEEIRSYLNKKLEEFISLQEIQKDNKEKFKEEFRKYLRDNSLLDFLSRLEHKRWCNSYYAMNFRYGEGKNENLKTHPCLIDDWEIVIGEKFDICHPEYDLLSVFTVFQKEN